MELNNNDSKELLDDQLADLSDEQAIEIVAREEIPNGLPKSTDTSPTARRGLDLIRSIAGAFALGPSNSGLAETPAEFETPRTIGETENQRAGGQTQETFGQPSQRDLPARIHRFEIVEELGRGGFGVVLLARDPILERLVALKLPRAESLGSPSARKRFEREARAAAMLAHPAIVPLFETQLDGAIQYIVFGYVPGETLAEHLARRNDLVSFQTSAKIVSRLADAVEHAHQRGVIHRDLKPNNVLIRSSGSGDPSAERDIVDSLCIADFGLAKLTGAVDGKSLTREGAILGTPSYMSPEQASGLEASIGPASDIWSLGAILYELITGRPPFKAESDLATLRLLETEIPRPPRAYNSAIPADLQAICMKCLEKDPAARYVSANDLQADLNRWLQGMPVMARFPGPVQRAWRWVQRHRLASALSGIALLSLLIGLGLTTWQWKVAQANLKQMELQRQRADLHLSNIDRGIDEILENLPFSSADSAGMTTQQRKTLERLAELRRELSTVESSNPRLASKSISTQLKMAQVNRRLGQYSQATAHVELAEQSIRAFPESDEDYPAIKMFLTDSLIERAVISHQLGDYQVALDRLSEASQVVEELRSTRVASSLAPLEVRCLRNRGMAFERLLNFKAALQEFEAAAALAQQEVLALADGEAGKSTPFHRTDIEFEWAMTLNSLAVLYSRTARADDSFATYQSAKKILAGLIEDNPLHQQHCGLAVAVDFNLGNAASRRKDWKAARELYEDALVTVRQLVANDPDDLSNLDLEAGVLGSLGVTEANLGDWESAKTHYYEAMELAEKHGDRLKAIQTRLRAANNLARMLAEDLHQPDEAESIYLLLIAEAQAASQRFPNEVNLSRTLSIAAGGLGKVYLEREDYPSAQKLFEQQQDSLLQALKIAPLDRDLPGLLMLANRDLATLCRDQAQLNEATQVLVEIAAAPPQSADMAYRSARELFRMHLETESVDARKDTIPEGEWNLWRQSLLDYCYQQLELAIERKLPKLSLLEQEDTIWEPLRSTDRFQSLLKSAR